jgi:hypothetical protein
MSRQIFVLQLAFLCGSLSVHVAESFSLCADGDFLDNGKKVPAFFICR